jgi:hypothetical protein
MLLGFIFFIFEAMIDLSVKEIYTIVGLLMLILAAFSYSQNKKLTLVYGISGAYLVLNYFLPKNLFFDIVSFLVIIFPFVYARVYKKSLLD